MPTTTTYCDHFGSLSNAYRLIGYKPAHRYRYRGLSGLLRRIYQKITANIVSDVSRVGYIELDHETHVLTIDSHLTVALVLVPYQGRFAQIAGWKLHLNQIQKCQAILLGRLNTENTDVLDYHLFPRCIFLRPTFRFTPQNIEMLSYYKLTALSEFYPFYRRNYFGEQDNLRL